MASLNRVTLIGNIGHTPKIKTLESGRKNAQFTLATNNFYKDQNGNPVTETDWHNIVTWGKLADLVEKFTHSGSQIFVEGMLKTREYTKEDGTIKKITEVIANKIILIDKSGNQPNSDNNQE